MERKLHYWPVVAVLVLVATVAATWLAHRAQFVIADSRFIPVETAATPNLLHEAAPIFDAATPPRIDRKATERPHGLHAYVKMLGEGESEGQSEGQASGDGEAQVEGASEGQPEGENSFSCPMSGSKVAPPVSTSASGTVEVNFSGSAITVTITHDVSNPTSAALRAGRPGHSTSTNLIDLGDPTSPIVHTFTASDMVILENVDEVYVAVFSAGNPDGEIRANVSHCGEGEGEGEGESQGEGQPEGQSEGQPEGEVHSFTCPMTGGNVVPAASTSASGTVQVSIAGSPALATVTITHDVVNPVSVALRVGGSEQSTAMDLFDLGIPASPIVFTFTAAEMAVLDYIENFYVAVYSAGYSDGEIRANVTSCGDGDTEGEGQGTDGEGEPQLVPFCNLPMSGDRVYPAVSTSATGTADIQVAFAGESPIAAEITITHDVASPTAAAIRLASPGTSSGTDLVNLGDPTSPIVYTLSTAELAAIGDNDAYIAIFSSGNTDGEIRANLTECGPGEGEGEGPVPVVFDDPNLEDAVRDWFTANATPLGGTIFSTDLVGVGFDTLDASERAIADLGGIEYCGDLVELNLSRNALASVTELSGLTSLEVLDIGLGDLFSSETFPPASVGLNDISDLSPLSGLTNLRYLNVSDNNDLTDIGVVTNFTNLETLFLGYQAIADFSPIEELSALQAFSAFNCGIDDTGFAYLSEKPTLSALAFHNGSVTSLAPIAQSTNLGVIAMDGNDITSLGALVNMTQLATLTATGNLIADLTPLVNNAGVGGADFYNLSGNPLSSDAVCDQVPVILTRMTTGTFLHDAGPCARTLTMEITGTGNTSPPPGSYPFDDDGTANMVAYPIAASGYAFGHWDGDASGTTQFNSLTMDGDKTVQAVFTSPADYTITISTTGDGDGNVYPGTGIFSYLSGREAVLLAEADPGHYFGGWFFSGSTTPFSIDPMTTVTVEQNYEIAAKFGATGYTLNLGVSGTGGVNPAAGTYAIAAGTDIALNAVVTKPGWYFDEWQGDIASMTAEDPAGTVTMDQNRSITAAYAFGSGQTVGGPCTTGTTIVIPDPVLRAHLMTALGVSSAAEITNCRLDDLEEFANFDLFGPAPQPGSGPKIADLSGLEYCIALERLVLFDTDVDDLGPLEDLPALELIAFGYSEVTSLVPLAGVSTLEQVNFQFSHIATLPNMASIWPNLTSLLITGAPLTNITPMQNHTALQQLYLSGTGIGDLGPLATIPTLELLDISLCWNLGPEEQAHGSRFTPLAPLVNLRELRANMLANPELAAMAESYVGQVFPAAPLQSIDGMENLDALETLEIRGNAVTDLTPLAGLLNFVALDATQNPLTDVDGLQSIGTLEEVILDGNTALSSLQALEDNTSFAAGDFLSLHGIVVTAPLCAKITAMEGRGATVAYDGDCAPYDITVVAVGSGTASGIMERIGTKYYIHLSAVPNPWMQSVQWLGTDGWVPNVTLGTGTQLTVELSGLPYTRTIQAVIGLPDFDLRASLDFLLGELGTDYNTSYWYDADFNGSDLGSYSANGIPDGIEFYLLEQALQGEAWPSGATLPPDPAVIATPWTHNRQVVVDYIASSLGGYHPAEQQYLIDALTAYCTLGPTDGILTADFFIETLFGDVGIPYNFNQELMTPRTTHCGFAPVTPPEVLFAPWGDPDCDGYENLEEWEYGKFFTTDKQAMTVPYINRAFDGTLPAIAPEDLPAVEVKVLAKLESPELEVSINPEPGTYHLAKYPKDMPEECQLWCEDRDGEPPAGCTECIRSTLDITVEDSEDSLFYRWWGLSEGDVYADSTTVKLYSARTVIAEFVGAEGRTELDLFSNAETVLATICGPDCDNNQMIYLDGLPPGFGPNGMVDGVEFALIQHILETPSLNYSSRSGVSHQQVYKAWSKNYAAAAPYTGVANDALRKVFTAYMTLGDYDNVQRAQRLLLNYGNPGTLDTSQFDLTQSQFLTADGDADNDGWSNLQEWEYVSPAKSTEDAVSYAAAAGDPTAPGGSPPSDSPTPGEELCPCADWVAVHLKPIIGVGQNEVLKVHTDPEGLTAAEIGITAQGYDNFRYFQDGTEVTFTFEVLDKTYSLVHWKAPDLGFDGSRAERETIILPAKADAPNYWIVDLEVQQGKLTVGSNVIYGLLTVAKNLPAVQEIEYIDPYLSEISAIELYDITGPVGSTVTLGHTFNPSSGVTNREFGRWQAGISGVLTESDTDTVIAMLRPQSEFANISANWNSITLDWAADQTSFSATASQGGQVQVSHSEYFDTYEPNYQTYDFAPALGMEQAAIPLHQTIDETTYGKAMVLAVPDPGYRLKNFDDYPDSYWSQDGYGNVTEHSDINFGIGALDAQPIRGAYGPTYIERRPHQKEQVAANFVPDGKRILVLERRLDGAGSVECAGYPYVDPDENGGARKYYPTANPSYKAKVTLRAVERPGYRIKRWTGNALLPVVDGNGNTNWYTLDEFPVPIDDEVLEIALNDDAIQTNVSCVYEPHKIRVIVLSGEQPFMIQGTGLFPCQPPYPNDPVRNCPNNPQGAPSNACSGLFDWASSLDTDIFDVRMYNEDDVNGLVDIDHMVTILVPGSGPVYNELKADLESGAVNEIVVVGHSHGGGSTRHLVELLKNQNLYPDEVPQPAEIGGPYIPLQSGLEFRIVMTGYVDAVKNDGDIDAVEETQKPPSEHHVNIFTDYPTGHIEGVREGCTIIPFHGVAIAGMSSEDDYQVNINTLSCIDNVEHGNIDACGVVHEILTYQLYKAFGCPGTEYTPCESSAVSCCPDDFECPPSEHPYLGGCWGDLTEPENNGAILPCAE